MRERQGKNVTLDQIFEDVYDLIKEASRIPLSNKVILNEDELSEVLERFREAIPNEVHEAGQVLDEQHNIVNRARLDAAAIVEQAENKAGRILADADAKVELMVQQEEIYKQAVEEAEAMKQQAEAYCEEQLRKNNEQVYQMKSDVLDYSEQMFSYLINQTSSALESLDACRQNVEKNKRAMDNEEYPSFADIRNRQIENNEEEEFCDSDDCLQGECVDDTYNNRGGNM